MREKLFVLLALFALLLVPSSMAVKTASIEGLPTSEVSVNYNERKEINFFVRNTGDEAINAVVSTYTPSLILNAQISSSGSISIAPGATVPVTMTVEPRTPLTITSPQTETVGVMVREASSSPFDVENVRVTVIPIVRSLEISDLSNVAVVEGGTVTANVDLKNAGNVRLSNVRLEVTGSFDGVASRVSPETVSLEVGETKRVSVILSTELGRVSVGDKSFTVNARSSEVQASRVKGFTLTVSRMSDASLLSFLDANGNPSSQVEFQLIRDRADTKTFKIKNNGGETLRITVEHNVGLKDSNNNVMSVSIEPRDFSLASGVEREISITAKPHSSQALDVYSGSLIVSVPGRAGATKSFDFRLIVQPELCSKGEQGRDLVITVENPDSDDEFKIGDTIGLDVNVENNAEDRINVKLEAFLYSGNKKVASESDKKRIKGGEEENFDLTLFIDPSKEIDLDDELVIYVQASESGNEEKLCTQERLPIDLIVESEDLLILSHGMNPRGEVRPGTEMSIDVIVINIGDDELENAYIQVSAPALGIVQRSNAINLEEYGNDEDSETRKVLRFTIPKDAVPGTYSFDIAAVLSNDEATDSVFSEEFIVMDVGQVVTPASLSDSVSLVSSKAQAREDKAFSYLVTLRNPRASPVDFEIRFEPSGEWASTGTVFETLEGGASKTVELEVIPLETGSQSGTISVKAEGSEVDILPVTAEIEETKEEEEGTEEPLAGLTVYTDKASRVLSSPENLLIAGGIVLLVIIVIILVAVMVRQQSRGYYLPPNK